MPCYGPIRGWYSSTLNPTGKRSIVFKESDGNGDSLEIPCGRCIGCRLERSRQWAIRILHESSLYDNNCFLTLTYDQTNLPKDQSLNLKHYQLFMKRLRKKFGPGIRFFHCGEYGEHTERPHYHACIFNFDFPDKYEWRKTNQGHTIWRSQILDGQQNNETTRQQNPNALWPHGNAEIGTLSFESAAYVARYITKKVLGPNSDLAYLHPNYKENGLIKQKEYTTMSRRPGIGQPWLKKYKSDVYPCDNIIIRGKQMRVPKYYDTQLGLENPILLEDLKELRAETAKKGAHDNTPERLQVKEICKEHQLKQLKRSYENDT